MNNLDWQRHCAQLKAGVITSLREGLYGVLKDQGRVTHTMGLMATPDMSIVDIERHLKGLKGEPLKMIRSLGAMENLTDEENQERKLFELNMEFLEAADWGDTVLGQALIDAGIDVNFRHPRRGKNALHIAAAQSRGFTRFLVNTGKCDYLLEDKQGRRPHDLASTFSGDRGLARLLFKKAAQQARTEGHDSLLDYVQSRNPPSL